MGFLITKAIQGIVSVAVIMIIGLSIVKVFTIFYKGFKKEIK